MTVNTNTGHHTTRKHDHLNMEKLNKYLRTQSWTIPRFGRYQQCTVPTQ